MRISFRVGLLGWIVPLLYFFYEPFAIQASRVPYSYIAQPMSDLGVTVCGIGTYPWADYAICSPHSSLVNVLFFVTAVCLLIGIISVYQRLSLASIGKFSFLLLVLFAIGNGFSAIPANISFSWHTYPVMFMIFVAPALFVIASQIKQGKVFTYSMATSLLFIKLGIIVMVFFPVEIGGLLQRAFYFVFYCWGLGMMIKLK
ncbi:hypothetical protein ACE1TH_10570 [Shouchella sp. JSM 1781072]|uniref:hypothetical protein n=1 Tax=Shouchella sp. JSM 1781072 TaxID=3344581 RepID=UPI0035BFD797